MSARRLIIHGGVRRERSRPRTTRVTNPVQPTTPRIGAVSLIVTEKPVPGVTVTASAGSLNVTPVAWAYSRATPRIDIA
ncbi:unannotated protein [freshwater metagenome]|uniref:Unannotated protein n=1 Tax=freshwater metagenome TaxID=449393 RepID=A0A6J7E3F0_9ZZZZ